MWLSVPSCTTRRHWITNTPSQGPSFIKDAYGQTPHNKAMHRFHQQLVYLSVLICCICTSSHLAGVYVLLRRFPCTSVWALISAQLWWIRAAHPCMSGWMFLIMVVIWWFSQCLSLPPPPPSFKRLRFLTYCLSPVRATRERHMWCIVRTVLVEAVRTLRTLSFWSSIRWRISCKSMTSSH